MSRSPSYLTRSPPAWRPLKPNWPRQAARTSRNAPRPRKEFSAHLELVEIVVDPEVSPGCEGLEKVLIGEDVL